MIDFNPRDHLINIKNRQGSSEYLPVQWRLVWFRNECPEGSIETELVHLDLEKEVQADAYVWNAEKRRSESVTKTARGIAIFKATVKDGRGGVATGYGSEHAADFGDFTEKAETKAIGRALAGLGYGTQFAPELNEEHRIVDAPVDFGHSDEGTSNGRTSAAGQNGQARGHQNSQQSSASPLDEATAPITERQLGSIHKLCEALGKSEPEKPSSFTFLNAKKLIQQLTAEYRQLHNQADSKQLPDPARGPLEPHSIPDPAPQTAPEHQQPDPAPRQQPNQPVAIQERASNGGQAPTARTQRQAPTRPPAPVKSSGPVFDSNPRTVTKQQIASLTLLCQRLGKDPLEHAEELSQLAAGELLQKLSTQYRELQAQQRAS